ncbi:MAG: hypothetical protein GY839_13030 [candidate division Zixibacteria bacterium]|nr:hypothetical protein [candidate division Zixibacteria bacterium]
MFPSNNNRILWYISVGLVFAAITGMSVLLIAGTNDKPNDKVKVSRFYPRGVVNEPTNITVNFSNKLMPDDSLNILTADVPLEFDPPLSGLARWIDNDELRFFPDTMFAPSTEYKIKVKSDRSYVNGNRIKESRTFDFRTPTFIVEGIRKEIINVPDDPNRSRMLVHIDFNYNVDYRELRKHTNSSFKRDGLSIDFYANDESSAKAFTLISEPFRIQEVLGYFEFEISEGLNCIGGQIPLQADFKHKSQIRKPKPLVISRVIPEEAGVNGRIAIRLSESVSLPDLSEYLTITPDVSITINQRYRHIYLYGNFKPGDVYTINIRRGLSSLNGETLKDDFSTKVQMQDLKPSLKFLDDGFFMSAQSSQLLAIEAINTKQISVEVEQIFANNIVYYLGGGRHRYSDPNISRVGRKIFSKQYKLPESKNEPVVSTFDLGEIVGDSLQGIYAVSVRMKDRRWNYINRRIMITDLGILARLSDSHMMVWVNTLSGTKPVDNARVNLISSNNQNLLEGYTNSKGVLIFENIGDKISGFEPFVITAGKGDDLSYLKFNECLLPTSEFDIKGRPFLSTGYESFIYSDRGVYRPGETSHLVSVIRGKNGVVPEGFPYKLYITDPQGRDFKEYKLSTGDGGIEAVDLTVPSFAKTGAYNVAAKIGDDIIGTYTIQVEEFMPDRIKTTLTTERDTYETGQEMEVTVNGTYLFGTPCAGNKVNGQLVIEPELFKAGDWPEFRFSNRAVKFTPVRSDLQNESLDKEGNHIYRYTIPKNLAPPSALKMLLSATVQESGGRAVSAYKGLMVHPYPIYLGLKKDYEGHAKVGEDVTYSVVAVNKNGIITSTDAIWAKFYRVIYQTIVKKNKHGVYRYVSEEQEQIIDSIRVAITDKPQPVKFTPKEYGSYRLKVFSPQTGHSSSLQFYASGWGYSPWAMTNPDRIELEFDHDKYRSGQLAKLLVKAPFSGRLLLTVEKDEVLEYHTYDLDSNTAEIELEIKPEYTPNVYITATLLKSTTSLERFSPARAFGLVPLNVENTDTRLNIALDAPSAIKPNQEIKVEISTQPGAILTIAVVDQGILQLTGFFTPDPYEFFYGKRRPSLRAYDIYSFIFPDIQPAQTMLSAAGGVAIDARRKRHVSPVISKRVKPVALWSGMIIADEQGRAIANFNIPQFNGKLAVMTVGFNGEKCGSAFKEIIVKDKILIQESLPRFITSGDKVKAKVVVFNNTDKDDRIEVSMNIDGPACLESDGNISLFVPRGEKSSAVFTLIGDYKPGNVTVDIEATNGVEKSNEKVDLPNRPPQPLLTKHGSGMVSESTPAKLSLPSDWLEGTAEYELKLSSIPAVRFSKSIQYLLRYPHGCLEQTTSKLFPLLYYNDIARISEPEIFGSKGPEYFIEAGIMKLTGMQLPSGGFSYWPGGNRRYTWAEIYASHFLVEARKAGYHVGDKVYRSLLKHLMKIANEAELEDNRGVLRIYAAYVLALADELDRSTLSGLKLLNIEKLPLYSKFQYGGAIALAKSPEDALWILPIKVHPEKIEPETGGFFNSSLRANAILLEILSELAPDNPSIPVLLDAITEDISIGRWYTTQGTAWALMAVGKFFKSHEQSDYTGHVVVAGEKIRSFKTEDVIIKNPAMGSNDIEISINGRGNCYYYWQASGVSRDMTMREHDNRMKVRREYLDSEGRPLDLSSIQLGDQVVAKITVEALDKNLENVIINDLLPTCLEIENPRLETAGQLEWVKGKSSGFDYMDIRDDRLLLFISLSTRRTFTYYYSMRVISSGEFIVPPVSSECMYDPTIKSAGSSGKIAVIDLQN